MRESTIMQVQGSSLPANCLILFQRDIQYFIGRFS